MSRSKDIGDRVVIYARGTNDEIAWQQEDCRGRAEREGATVAALATDAPDTSTGWASAQAMLARGEADRILVSSRSVIPPVIESVTGEIPKSELKRPPSPGRRRPNLLC